MRLKVPIENILGSAYYHYEITSTDYNPNIDSTITLSVSVKSVFGNPIKDKSVTLYDNGDSVSTSTTNTTGVATFSYTFNDWENHHFTCNSANLDLMANGWKQVTVSNGNLWVNERAKLARYVLSRTGTITSEISYSNIIPSAYRPQSNVRMLAHNSTYMGKIVIESSGTVRISGGTSSTSITVACELTYAFL